MLNPSMIAAMQAKPPLDLFQKLTIHRLLREGHKGGPRICWELLLILIQRCCRQRFACLKTHIQIVAVIVLQSILFFTQQA